MSANAIASRRQVVYWRLLAAIFGFSDQAAGFEHVNREIVQELDLPELILDPRIAIDTLLHRYPELEADFRQVLQQSEENVASERGKTAGNVDPDSGSLRHALVFSKLLLNIFGLNTRTPVVTAQQYSQWLQDVGHLERACGFDPGGLRGQGGRTRNIQRDLVNREDESRDQSQSIPDMYRDEPEEGGQDWVLTSIDGNGRGSFVSEEPLQAALKEIEGDLIKRMALREILQSQRLAASLTPSMPLVEQLLRDKAHLSGVALANAKRLIRLYVDQLTELLKLQVHQAPAGKVDATMPPKRVFRNLDLRRTLWKNLINWDPDTRRLYVDRLYYRHTARKKTPTRMIVVVDQSGSMVDAMVQCAILASIFAGVPNVDVHLLAFDTRVLDLTPWVHDPFETLLRTELGGGNDGPKAMLAAMDKIIEPRHTAMVWVSDFYEFDNCRPLFEQIKAVKESGVHFIPVGAMTSSGYFSVNDWFRTRLKDLGTPILTGSPKKLIEELKKVIVV